MSCNIILVFQFAYFVWLIKFAGNGYINESELDAFLKAFEDEVIFLLLVFVRFEPLLLNRHWQNFSALSSLNHLFLKCTKPFLKIIA